MRNFFGEDGGEGRGEVSEGGGRMECMEGGGEDTNLGRDAMQPRRYEGAQK